MKDRLDFLVGGIPRTGTTYVGTALGTHPDVFCYYAETHLLVLLRDLAGDRPISVKRTDAVRRFLELELNNVLLDMARTNAKEASDPSIAIFDEALVRQLTDACMELLAGGLCGAECLEEGSALLARVIRARVGADIVGEKTPANCAVLAEYPQVVSRAGFFLVREPFATIGSMYDRGLNDHLGFNGSFKGGVERNAGMYLQYGTEILRARATGSDIHVTRYEDLAASADVELSKLLHALDVRCDESLLEAFRRSFAGRVKPYSLKWTAEDVATVRGILSETCPALGYTDACLDDLAASLPLIPLETTSRLPGVVPLYGVYEPDIRDGARWMEKEASLLLYVRPEHRSAAFSFWTDYPEEYFADGPIRITVSSTSACIAELDVDKPHHQLDFEVSLEDAPRFRVAESLDGVRLDVRSSASNRQIAGPAGGRDRRDTAVLLLSATLA